MSFEAFLIIKTIKWRITIHQKREFKNIMDITFIYGRN